MTKFVYPAKRIKGRNGQTLKRKYVLIRTEKNLKVAEIKKKELLQFYKKAETRRDKDYIGVYHSFQKRKDIVGELITQQVETITNQVERLGRFTISAFSEKLGGLEKQSQFIRKWNDTVKNIKLFIDELIILINETKDSILSLAVRINSEEIEKKDKEILLQLLHQSREIVRDSVAIVRQNLINGSNQIILKAEELKIFVKD